MQKRMIAVVIIAALLMPAPAHAWGYAAHRFIVDHAIALLPLPVRPLFEQRRAGLVERAIDPDLWRRLFDTEAPNHQLDMDTFGPYPFKELPRDYSAAVAKFGLDAIRGAGTLPWRVDEIYGKLRREFEDYGRSPTPVNQENIVIYAAALTHYISDAHVPFHAVLNYDGQLTNQRGVHGRFEAGAFTRFRSRLSIAPTPIPPIANPRDFAFDALTESARLSLDVLRADAAAIGSGDVYDDAYFDAFFAGVRPVLERRVNESIAASAAIIAGAWEAAGKPPVAFEIPPESPQRRQR